MVQLMNVKNTSAESSVLQGQSRIQHVEIIYTNVQMNYVTYTKLSSK